MLHKKIINNIPPPSEGLSSHHIEKAAYYKWLQRAREMQVGDEVKDWIEAEKELEDGLKVG